MEDLIIFKVAFFLFLLHKNVDEKLINTWISKVWFMMQHIDLDNPYRRIIYQHLYKNTHNVKIIETKLSYRFQISTVHSA